MRKAKSKGRRTQAAPVEVIHPQQIIVAPQPIQVAAPPSAAEVQKAAERQVQIRKGYIKLIAANLRPEQVLVFGGGGKEEVYLPKHTAMMLLGWAAINVKFDGSMEEHRYSSPDGDYIEFVIEGIVSDPSGREVPVMGNRSTRDEFFGIAGKDRVCPTCHATAIKGKPWPEAKYDTWYCKDHPTLKCEEVIHYLPLHDVDLASVRQAAVSNLWNHALEAIGLRPSLIDLKEAGMDTTKCQFIGFGSSRTEEKKPAKKNDAPAEQPKTVSDRTGPQSTNDRTTGATHSEKPAGPPKANTPKELRKVSGVIQEVVAGVSKNKSPYRKVKMQDVTYYVFDNKEKATATKGATLRVFDVLDTAGKPGIECEAIVEDREVNDKWMPTIVILLRVGLFEWESDGTPILRREPGE